MSPCWALLGDVIALPTWLPGTNVISLGDILIAIGIVTTLAVAMVRARRPVSIAIEPTPV